MDVMDFSNEENLIAIAISFLVTIGALYMLFFTTLWDGFPLAYKVILLVVGFPLFYVVSLWALDR